MIILLPHSKSAKKLHDAISSKHRETIAIRLQSFAVIDLTNFLLSSGTSFSLL